MQDWFLVEWMEATKVRQRDMMKAFDWPRAKASDIVNGKTRYNRDIVNEIASLMNVRPFELLMHPDDAMAIRRLREAAARIVENEPLERDGTRG